MLIAQINLGLPLIFNSPKFMCNGEVCFES